MYNHGTMFSLHDQEDKSSLEAAAEAAAKVNAMLIAKGMLKPNQIHSAANVITKKSGGPNSLVVAEVEINNLTSPCRNTLTRGTTQEEISKASGAAVTTRGRYMAPEEKARNPRDRCLYLNVQAATKESVDIAVLKINEIIRSMCGNKVEAKSRSSGQNRAGRIRPSFRPNTNNSRFGFRGQPPPPLMSLPTPPPPQGQITSQNQPPPQIVTILQENLYIGLEHAPPNFDTKNKILGPGGSYLMHIQAETGAAVSLRGKGSGFHNMSALESIEPMHVHLEHHSYVAIQEAKKLAENLIQTVQQSYVSFQQALAALPASVPTGLITGLPQQPPYVETQMGAGQHGLATISMTEQTLHALQPQVQQLGPPMLMPPGSVANQLSQITQGQTLMIPSSISLTSMSLMNQMPVSATSLLPQQPTHIDLGGQQQIVLSQPPPGTPHTLTPVGLQQMVPAPCPVQQPLPSHYGAYTHVQPTMHLVSQPVSMASHALVHQTGPPMLTQGPQHILAPQPGQPISMSVPSSLVYTMASTAPPFYTSPKLEEEPKRRFTEEKDDKIPDNLLGYQHGPPHLVNLVRSSPPPHAPISQGMVPPPGAQLIQTSHHGLIHVSHIDQGEYAQTILQQSPQMYQPSPEGQQPFAAGHPFLSALPPPHFMTGPPPPSLSPQLPPSPGLDNRPPSRGAPSNGAGVLMPPPPPSNGAGVLMPPPPPPSNLTPQPTENRKEDDIRTMPPPKSTELPWGSGSRRRGISPSPAEPDKKKMRGILKTKASSSQENSDKDLAEIAHVKPENADDDKRHPASPQYQGQPLRYPSMPSDPNFPPTCQESGVTFQHRPLPQQVQGTLPPGHHLVHQSDPTLQQLHISHPHLHIEGSRSDVQPAQIVIEHPGVPGNPIQITHHRVAAPGQIHIEHALTGPPPRQMLLEHQAPPTLQLEHQSVPSQGHPEHIHIPVSHPAHPEHIHIPVSHPEHIHIPVSHPEHIHIPVSHPEHIHIPVSHPEHIHIPVSHPGQPPTSQELFDFELGGQQQATAQYQQTPPQYQQTPPQYQQTFEHITVSQASQPGEHLLAPGSAVIVSSTQHYPQYSVAISTAAPPPVSYTLPAPSPFAMQGQHPISQHIQRLPDQQHLSMPPPQQPSYTMGITPPQQPSYTMGITPSPPHFQPQFAAMQSASQASIPAHLFHQTQQPPPPPSPAVSQHQYQTHPQGISYWVTQT